MPVVAGDLMNLSPWPDCKSLEGSGQLPAAGPLLAVSPSLHWASHAARMKKLLIKWMNEQTPLKKSMVLINGK